MTDTEGIMEKIKEEMPYLRERYKVKNVGIFGSYIRGDNNKESDVDILVEFHEPPTLLEFVALERHIAELAGRKVDLVMKTALKPGIGERILQEVVYV
jgi:predicted nucleotidyltransferase